VKARGGGWVHAIFKEQRVSEILRPEAIPGSKQKPKEPKRAKCLF